MSLFLTKLLHSRRNQTIADQIMVSGSNFATGVILVRGLGLEQFGVFTVAYALILLGISLQLSFICSPMITLAALSEDGSTRARYLRGMFGVQLRFCAVVTVAVAIVSGAFLWFRPQFGGARLLPAFLLSVVFFLMQDWLRRYYFAAGKSQHSLWNDAISYIGQAVALLGLMLTHRLTVNTAFWSIAITSAAAFLLGEAFERIGYSKAEVRESWHQSRGLSRDLSIASQLQWLVYQGAMLIGAAVLGAEAAGSVRATQNIVGPVNVAYQAMENLVPLKAGEEMRRGGIRQVAKFLFRFGIKGFLVLSVLFLGIGLFARGLLSFFLWTSGCGIRRGARPAAGLLSTLLAAAAIQLFVSHDQSDTIHSYCIAARGIYKPAFDLSLCAQLWCDGYYGRRGGRAVCKSAVPGGRLDEHTFFDDDGGTTGGCSGSLTDCGSVRSREITDDLHF